MVELIIIKIPLTNNKTPMVTWLSQSLLSGGVREEAVVEMSAKAEAVGGTSAKTVADTNAKAGEAAASVEEVTLCIKISKLKSLDPQKS